jgi:hypothetical protein
LRWWRRSVRVRNVRLSLMKQTYIYDILRKRVQWSAFERIGMCSQVDLRMLGGDGCYLDSLHCDYLVVNLINFEQPVYVLELPKGLD